ncbi:MAG: ribonuclease H-like domain-containing protein [Nitrospirae bacterium]|nr:ribonuclease H-like domain-containing protein [Nitrospirota bacterium]
MKKTQEYAAYLDIETTGLSADFAELTVIGIHLENGCDEVVQLIGDEISGASLLEVIKGVHTLYTYNGSRFDLPFIKQKLRIDLNDYCPHKDLMYSCWQRNLKGGLKSVERQLGIERKLTGVDGWMAVRLWHDYSLNGCAASLDTLLEYNREDVLNLKKLREMLKA